MRLLRSLVVVFSVFVSVGCVAQEPAQPQPAQQPTQTLTTTPVNPHAKPAPKTRPTIGVALEGGGALGEAHIGVLKWFEEHHIPIDYIAGTSMGGLVGGMYATGKSADQITEILKTAKWDLLLGGQTPYEDLTFRRKEDARDIPSTIVIGLKHGPALPPGLNSGQQVTLLIDRETLPYSTVHSFDDLPIPFRCVSTELISGKAYVFEKGSLSEAMRATMSIPGVFAPVRRDNQIFVDGGMVDNLPTDVVQQMGADLVIGVHLQIAPASAKEIQSAFSILGRAVEVVIAETELRGMEGADLVVKANVEKYDTMDYEKVDELVKIGYEAAEQRAQFLKQYELDDEAWAAYQKDKASRIRTAIGTPQFIKVEGVQGESLVNIQRFLSPLVGKPLDEPLLQQYLTRLSGIGIYDNVTYDVIRENDKDGLLIRVHETSYAPPILRPGVLIDGSQPDNVTFTTGARLTLMDVAGYRSEWRTDFQLGESYGLRSDLYRPFLPLSRWFMDPFVSGSETTFFVYKKLNPLADYRITRVNGGLDVGYAFSRYSQVRVGYGIGYDNEYLRLGTPDFPSNDGRVGGLRARYVLDHTDDPVIPTAGYYVQSNFNFYDTYPGATEAFPSAELTVQYFHPFKNDSIFIIGSGGSTFGYRGTGDPQFFLGGVGRLTAYGLNELLGNQYFVSRVGYLHQIAQLPTFVGKGVYVIGYGEVGKMYEDPFGAPRLSGDGTLGVIADTFLGPIFVGGAAGDTGHYKWFFQLGRVF